MLARMDAFRMLTKRFPFVVYSLSDTNAEGELETGRPHRPQNETG